jgi:hypothetical protein
MLCRRHDSLSRLHALKFLDLLTPEAILESEYVFANVIRAIPHVKSKSQTNANIAGCSEPGDLRRADASIKFATTADIVADILSR